MDDDMNKATKSTVTIRMGFSFCIRPHKCK